MAGFPVLILSPTQNQQINSLGVGTAADGTAGDIVLSGGITQNSGNFVLTSSTGDIVLHPTTTIRPFSDLAFDLGAATFRYNNVFGGTLRADTNVDFHYASIALGGGATPTFGTIGGTGPATAAQNAWLKVSINGTASFIPFWR